MGSEPLFTAGVESRNGVTRIALSGELDMTTVATLKEHLAQAEQSGAASIMVDLRDLAFIDSQGLHAFLKARERAQSNGHRLLFVAPSPFARRLFQLTCTEFLIDEQETVSVLQRFAGAELQPAMAEISDETSDA